jgi:tetratricopeptide (TPR) repeat protein
MAAADRSIAILDASPQRLEGLPYLLLRRSAIALQIHRLDEAEADAAKALAMAQQAAEPGTPSTKLGRAHLARGRALQAQGKLGDARVAFALALEHLEPSLGSDHPDTREARRLAAPAKLQAAQ